jgi:GNAT superfamily N-acetyltransferase
MILGSSGLAMRPLKRAFDPPQALGLDPTVPPRRATSTDALAIAEIHVASWQKAYRGMFPDDVLDQLSVTERRRLWEPRLVPGDWALWVGGGDVKPAGFIAACPSRDDDAPPPAFAEIAALYVHPVAWGTGCGRALCEVVFEHLSKTPAQSVIVWVLTGNMPARRFYEHLGFKVDDGRRDLTRHGITLPEVRYRRNLR